MGSGASISYVCPNGQSQYALTNCPGQGLPNLLIETSTNSGGSDCGHWSEARYDAELMTPTSENVAVVQPLSRFTIGAAADIWGPVDYNQADPYSCSVSSVIAQSSHTSEEPDVELLYPVNVKDVLIARANAGETVYEQQLAHLTPAEQQEVIDALAALGKTIDTTPPVEIHRRKRRD